MVYLSSSEQVHFFTFLCATALDLGLTGFLFVAVNQRRYRNGGLL